MSHATRMTVLAKSMGKTVARIAHGGLLAVGVATVAHISLAYLEHDSVSFADTGLISSTAHAASAVSVVEAMGYGGGAGPESADLKRDARPTYALVQPASVGDRWRVSPRALLGHLEDHALPGEVALSEEMQRVRDWVSRKYRVSGVALEPVLAVAEESAKGAGLDPLLIVAMMAIESSFNPMAESHAGAQGLMQVIPKWHMDKIGENAPDDILFDPLVNVQVGTKVLVEGLQRYGTLQAALQYYGGARNDPEARYTKRVMAMKRQIMSAARSNGDA